MVSKTSQMLVIFAKPEKHPKSVVLVEELFFRSMVHYHPGYRRNLRNIAILNSQIPLENSDNYSTTYPG